MTKVRYALVVVALGAAMGASDVAAQSQPAAGVLPSDYVIGPDDVLSVSYWREKDLSADVVVRPDGKISLPLLDEIDAAGLTPTELLARIIEKARRYVEEPTATVVVKQVNSRKVFITGSVAKPGAYSLTQPTSVLQLIALAGGLSEWANTKSISVVRTLGNRQQSFRFNYAEVAERKNLNQNIQLEPGDTVIVP